MMEQQLAAINMSPEEQGTKIQMLEEQCMEKDEFIRSLQQQLEEQVEKTIYFLVHLHQKSC